LEHLFYVGILIVNSKEAAAPVFKSLVLGRPIAAEVLIERIPLDDIPEDSDKAANWLHQNFHHKVLAKNKLLCFILMIFFTFILFDCP
jgi:hypothetical protein